MQVLSVSLASHNPRLWTCIWHKIVDFMSTCPHSNLGMEKDRKWYNLEVYHITFTRILIARRKKNPTLSHLVLKEIQNGVLFYCIIYEGKEKTYVEEL